MVCVAVTYLIRAGEEEAAAGLLKKMIPLTRQEPGCRMYLVHRSPTDPRTFFLYEQYDDQAALDAHRGTPYFEEYVKGGLWPIIESRTPELYDLLEP